MYLENGILSKPSRSPAPAPPPNLNRSPQNASSDIVTGSLVGNFSRSAFFLGQAAAGMVSSHHISLSLSYSLCHSISLQNTAPWHIASWTSHIISHIINMGIYCIFLNTVHPCELWALLSHQPKQTKTSN